MGAGTVTIPGLVWSGNVSTVCFRAWLSRQVVRQRDFENQAIRNQVLSQVAQGYMELLRGEAAAPSPASIEEAREVARITANYAKAGQGRQADADRAATESDNAPRNWSRPRATWSRRRRACASCWGWIPRCVFNRWTAGWSPSYRARADSAAGAFGHRLDTAARAGRTAGRHSRGLAGMRDARAAPLFAEHDPGYSAGDFGGGSNLVQQGIVQPNGTVLQQSRFGNYADRQDFDVMVYWSLRNLGVGNSGSGAQSNLRQNELRNLVVAIWTEEKGRLVLTPITLQRIREIRGFLKPKPGERSMFEEHFADRERERERERRRE